MISYQHTEFRGEDESVTNNLLGFVYDIPYFGACGIFPPLHIANNVFLSGGGDGGMGPGAISKPFQIMENDYHELVRVVKMTDPHQLKGRARFIDVQFQFDSDFDHIHDHMEWVAAVCDKHREAYQKRKKIVNRDT